MVLYGGLTGEVRILFNHARFLRMAAIGASFDLNLYPPAGTAPRVLSGTGTHIVVATRLVSEAEIIVSAMERRLSFAGMSVSAMEIMLR